MNTGNRAKRKEEKYPFIEYDMVNTISELKRGVNEVQIAIDSLGTKLDKEGSKFGFLDLGS